MKRTLRCRGYVRYVDDMLLFSDDKSELWTWKTKIVERLARLRLTIHGESAQALPVTAGIPWLGFVVFPDHRRLKRRNVVNCRRRFALLKGRFAAGLLPLGAFSASVRGWLSHARHGDTWALRGAILRSLAK